MSNPKKTSTITTDPSGLTGAADLRRAVAEYLGRRPEELSLGAPWDTAVQLMAVIEIPEPDPRKDAACGCLMLLGCAVPLAALALLGLGLVGDWAADRFIWPKVWEWACGLPGQNAESMAICRGQGT